MAKPLVFHSKLLCLSLLYLLTTLPFSIYISYSSSSSSPSPLQPAACVFRSPAAPLILPAVFSYPSSYGEHKYALPSSRSSCSSPLHFQDYEVAVDEIRDLSRRSSPESESLKYMTGKRSSFAGNFSTPERRSFFDHTSTDGEVPCGFFKEFPVRDSDRSAMERCRELVVVSAIFGDHDKIRQPKGLGAQTLDLACFFMFIDDVTLKGLQAHNMLVDGSDDPTIGVWRIVRLKSGKLPYRNPAMNGVIAKHLVHRLFPNARFSVWVDAKLQLVVDPVLLVHSLVVAEDAEVAVSQHPFNKHTMEEAVATARWRKWPDLEGIRMQMETYCENGLQPWSPTKLPYTTDVPDTALIVRRHGLGSNLLSCLLFNELEAFNPRDQLPFAYVRDQMVPGLKLNMFDVEVFEHVAIEYRHNLKRAELPIDVDDDNAGKTEPPARMASVRDIEGSPCQAYLLKMWGELND